MSLKQRITPLLFKSPIVRKVRRAIRLGKKRRGCVGEFSGICTWYWNPTSGFPFCVYLFAKGGVTNCGGVVPFQLVVPVHAYSRSRHTTHRVSAASRKKHTNIPGAYSYPFCDKQICRLVFYSRNSPSN